MRRLCVALVISLSVGLPASAAFAGTATTEPEAVAYAETPVTEPAVIASADTEVPSTTAFDWSCSKPAVQQPNCGVKPEQAGDRGGALQYTVWALLIAGLAVVFTVVFRSAARTNRRKVSEVGDSDWS